MTSKKKDIKWPEGPVKLSDEDFSAFVKDHPKVVVDCWADWCGPCRKLGPVIKELAGAHKGEIAFGKLDVDENDKVADQFGVRGIPTLLVFQDGEHVDTLVGYRGRSELEKELLDILGKGGDGQ